MGVWTGPRTAHRESEPAAPTPAPVADFTCVELRPALDFSTAFNSQYLPLLLTLGILV